MFRAAGKQSAGKEMARLRREATEERARLLAAAVSPVDHFPLPYTPPPDDNLRSPLTVPITSLWTVLPGLPSSWANKIPNESWAYDADGERIPTQLAPAVSCSPRDWSTLRSDSAHPWRAIRRRNYRLRPQRPERRPFPRSLPKTVQSLPPPPIHAILVDPSPTLPAETPYGVVESGLALACASELPDGAAVLDDLFDLVWGLYAHDDDKNHLVRLPTDQLVFLCTLAKIVALEPVFATFLHPVISDFTIR